MWKAILVLVLTSSSQPMSMMLGQFPAPFTTEAKCRAFLEKTRGDIDKTVEVFVQQREAGVEVLDHRLSCVEDTSGETA